MLEKAEVQTEPIKLLQEITEQTAKQIKRDALRVSLLHYVESAWSIIEPTTEYNPGWHIELMCEYLEAVSCHKIKDLIILVPPRHMKSTLVSVFWPTWIWASYPSHRLITTSYAGNLATRDSVRSRRVMESPWYRKYFGHMFKFTSDQNVKNRYDNDKTGYRIASSVGGAMTGEGGDTIICDDPHNLAEIHSKTVRESTLRWWNEVMSTRRNDPNISSRVVIMQRGHQTDLAGDIIKRGGFEVVELPAESPKRASVRFPISSREVVREEGALLWPGRFDKKAITEIRNNLGSYASAAQLDQKPVPEGGAIFKQNWWQYYKELPEFLYVIQSYDTAFKKGEENDYSVCITIGVTAVAYYVIGLWRDRVEFPELERRVVQIYDKHKPVEIVIEDKASGQSLIQSLRRSTNLPITLISPYSDKITRAHAVSPIVEAGKVFLPERADWLADFIDETNHFPNAEHDDQVDAFNQVFEKLLGIGKKTVGVPRIT